VVIGWVFRETLSDAFGGLLESVRRALQTGR